MVQLKENLFAIVVPKDAYGLNVQNKLKIVGTLLDGIYDFYCVDYVERAKYSNTLFKDYRVNETNSFYEASNSFGSLLESKGIHLDNIENKKFIILEKM